MHFVLLFSYTLLFSILPFSLGDDDPLAGPTYPQSDYLTPHPEGPPVLKLSYNYLSPDVQTTAARVSNILYGAQILLCKNVTLSADFRLMIDNVLTNLTSIDQIAALLKIDITSILSDLINLYAQYNTTLRDFRNKLKEDAETFQSLADSFHDVSDSSIATVLLLSQQASLRQKIARARGYLHALEYVRVAIIGNIKNAFLIYINPLTIVKTNIKADLILFIEWKFLSEEMKNQTIQWISDLESKIDDLSDRIQKVAANVFHKVEDVLHDIHNDTEKTKQTLRDILIDSHPAIIDAAITATVTTDSATFTVTLSVDITLGVDHHSLLAIVQGAVSVAVNAPLNNVQVSANNNKKRGLFTFSVTLSSTGVVDLSVGLTGTFNFTLPPPPTPEQLAEIRNKFTNNLQKWLADSLILTPDEIRNRIAQLQQNLLDNGDNETNYDLWFNQTERHLDDGCFNYTKSKNKTKDLDMNDSLTVALSIIENRRMKLQNSLNQIQAYIFKQRFLFHRTQRTVILLKIRLFNCILNGTASYNDTFNILIQTFLNLQTINKTVQDLLDQKDNLEQKIENDLTDLESLVTQVKANAKANIKAKLNDIKARFVDKVNDLKEWLKSDVEDLLDGAEVGADNLTSEVNQTIHAIVIRFRILAIQAIDLIKKAITNSLVASGGIPSSSITVDINVGSKRSTSSSVTATIATDTSSSSPTTSSPTKGTSPPSSSTTLSVFYGLILLVITSFIFLM